jgi:hypothetical protein
MAALFGKAILTGPILYQLAVPGSRLLLAQLGVRDVLEDEYWRKKAGGRERLFY